MENGYKKHLKKEVSNKEISKWMNLHDESVNYTYTWTDKDGEKRKDTIVIEVNKLRDVVLEDIDYSKIKEVNKRFIFLFISSYIFTFLRLMLVELLKGNTVVLGNKEIGFSLHSLYKVRQYKERVIQYTSLKIYVHISEKLFKKSKLVYYSHLDKRFRKAIRNVRKNIQYYRYPSNFLEE